MIWGGDALEGVAIVGVLLYCGFVWVVGGEGSGVRFGVVYGCGRASWCSYIYIYIRWAMVKSGATQTPQLFTRIRLQSRCSNPARGFLPEIQPNDIIVIISCEIVEYMEWTSNP